MSKNIGSVKFNSPSKQYEERFEMLMKLVRIDKMLRTAQIIKKDSKE
jgi:hypothetical protein